MEVLPLIVSHIVIFVCYCGNLAQGQQEVVTEYRRGEPGVPGGSTRVISQLPVYGENTDRRNGIHG